MSHILLKINSDYSIGYVLIRTFIIYIYAVLLLRFGSSRFRLQAPFDYVLVVILGAILGRTIYGGASLISTIAASLLLIVSHEILAKLSFKYKYFGAIVKGKPKILVNDGKLNPMEMQKSNITVDDLMEVCRNRLNSESFNDVIKGVLERSGEINFLTSPSKKRH